MPSDKTRTSDDTSQGYKGPVMQQGRVILDRDFNALHETLSEAVAADALQIIGTAGTPDDGFDITIPTMSSPPSLPVWTPPAPLSGPASPPVFDDFLISPGTMYVGGQRVVFPGGATYSYYNQPDWINPEDPAGGQANALPPQELVYLHLHEQEVSAVEDPDLRDVALGGPDTTQRVRLMRRVRRLGVTGSLCSTALNQAEAAWLGAGQLFDPDTMRLLPQATLRVHFTQSVTTADPCDPAMLSGYLGAENQLIRVQIQQDDKGNYVLLWGYDNASFLYRATVSNDTTLTLQQSPVDAFHCPKTGQVIELLPAAAILGSAPDEFNPQSAPQIVRCVAEAYGETRTITRDYDPATMTLSFDSGLNSPPPVGLPFFARIWQAMLPFDPAGDTVELTADVSGVPASTGLLVDLAFPAGIPPLGAYWMIAVRPGTPQAVYPERFIAAPQPPDGPLEWVCPLAVIDWTPGNAPVADCRAQFDNLISRTEVEDLIDMVVGRDAAGQPVELSDGATLAGGDLAQGLDVLLRQNVNPATATVGSCFVTLELPYLLPDGTLVGFQPTVIAAAIAAQNATTITWNPTVHAQQFLSNQLPPVPTTHAFESDWSLSPLPPNAIWQYTSAGATVAVASYAVPVAGGYRAINNQVLPTGANSLSLSLTPSDNNMPSSHALIFNYISPSDFWALTFTSYSSRAEDDYLGIQTSFALYHYVNNQAVTVGQGNSPTVWGVFQNLTLRVDGSRSPMAFTAALTMQNGGYSITTPYSITFPTASTPGTPAASALASPLAAIASSTVARTNVGDETHVSAVQNSDKVRERTQSTYVPWSGAAKTGVTDTSQSSTSVANIGAAKTGVAVTGQSDTSVANIGTAKTGVTVSGQSDTSTAAPASPPPLPPGVEQLLAGTSVGIATDYNGVTNLTQMQITYAGNPQPQVLLPASDLGRMLGRLTVKRDLLTPADVQGNLATSARPDFSRWFWVAHGEGAGAHSGSGSSAGSGGIGVGDSRLGGR